MRWGRKQQQLLQREEKKSFSLSHLLPFSWVCKLIPNKPRSESVKTKRTTQITPIANPKPVPVSTSNDLDHFLARFPPPIAESSAGYVPRRLSLGDDDGLRPRTRHVRHYSVGGDRDIAGSQTLGHLIPFSRSSDPPPPPSPESEPSEIDVSAARLRERRRRRRRRRAAGEVRRSFSGRIRARSSRIRIRSPRIPRAEEEEEEEEEKEETDLEKFAVVKKSSDPKKDFRESMVEMIAEKGIGRPEELESLLACYLTLNSDEHHDVIVQVFRQVWFEINPERFGSHHRSNSTPI